MGEPERPALKAIAAEAGVCPYAIGMATKHYMRSTQHLDDCEVALAKFAGASRKMQARSIIAALSHEGYPDYGMCGESRGFGPGWLIESGSADAVIAKLRTWA